MGSAQSSLPSFIFPEMSESDLKLFVNSLNSDSLDLKYERTLGKGRVSWSMLVRNRTKSLLLMRLYAKRSKTTSVTKRRSASIIPAAIDPLSATKLSFIHELYYEKCAQFDFVLKPLLINDSDDFLVMVRPFARYNLTDRLITESLCDQDKFWIALQLFEAILKLHSLRAFHGDFGSGKVFLTSNYKILIGDFAPIKPFSLQNKNQNPIEFYQIWFDEGLEGDCDEIGRGCYLAPERLKFNSIENFETADLFSLGCVLVELFGVRAFLQFSDVLSLSQSNSTEEYNELLATLVDRTEMNHSDIIPIVKRLCARDPNDRKLLGSDLLVIQSKIDPQIANWRHLLASYRFTNNFYTKKEIIAKLPGVIEDFDAFLLVCLKEKDPILSGLLVSFMLQHTEHMETCCLLVKVFNENFKDFKFVKNVIMENLISKNQNCSSIDEFPLIQAFNSGLRDNLFKFVAEYADLKEVVELASSRLSGEKLMSLLNKLLQIYRKRDFYDSEFEARIAFEYLRIEAEEDDLKTLFKTCWKFREKYAENTKVSLSRIAYQLDLEKNKVPIESSGKSGQSKSSWILKRSVSQNSTGNSASAKPKLKQRVLNEAIKWVEKIHGILQSPDKTFIIGYNETTLHFWDMKSVIRTRDGEPLASVNPRADAIITSVIFGSEPDSLIISFQDGIIGLYKIVGSAKEFNIRESFGPFECGNLQLLMTRTFRNGPVLLVIGKLKIYGISPSDGEIFFEFTLNQMEIRHVIDLVEGCVLVLDSCGRFQFIEVFYETGQILATWQLESSDDSKWEIEAVSVKVAGTKVNLFVKMGTEGSRVILVYRLDPLCEIALCTFRHWTIGAEHDDKSLPLIKCKRVSIDCRESLFKISQLKSLIGLDEEIVDCSDGILRLIDFSCISSSNSTSILHPNSYKPSIKLRNKKGQIPEIVEKTCPKGNTDSCKNTIEKLLTFDEKNVLIVSIIDNEIIFYY